MIKNYWDKTLMELGREIESKRFEETQQHHVFSKQYQEKKRAILREKKCRDIKGEYRKYLQGAAILLLLAGVSFSVYAAVKDEKAVKAVIQQYKETETLSMEFQRKKDTGYIYIYGLHRNICRRATRNGALGNIPMGVYGLQMELLFVIIPTMKKKKRFLMRVLK